MDFDWTKPLGDKLELYLSSDIDAMCDELYSNGIVFESQFSKLKSMVCKMNSTDIIHLLSQKSGLEVFYSYDKETCNFVYYDMDRFTMIEAVEMSKIYQKSHGNCETP